VKNRTRLLTLIVAILFVLAMAVSPAFAEEAADVNPTDLSQTESTTTETEEEPPRFPHRGTDPVAGAIPIRVRHAG